jgi:hypothetical protein
VNSYLNGLSTREKKDEGQLSIHDFERTGMLEENVLRTYQSNLLQDEYHIHYSNACLAGAAGSLSGMLAREKGEDGGMGSQLFTAMARIQVVFSMLTHEAIN